MGEQRTVEDRLRAEYAELQPHLQRVRLSIETEVQHALLPLSLKLNPYERLVVRSRIKECESAVDALRRRQEFGLFDTDNPQQYSLKALPDLVGVRVLTFPDSLSANARSILLPRISTWADDPVPGEEEGDSPIAQKFNGYWEPNDQVRSEIQIVSLLIGLFWEAEHSAIYKPTPNLRGATKSIAMRQKTTAVIAALRDFELAFGRLIQAASEID